MRSSGLEILLGISLSGLVLLPACISEDVESRFSKGLELLYENRHKDAESHFLALAREMAHSDRPDAPEWQAKALFQSGLIDHLYQDQPYRAVGRLREALKIHPRAPFAFEARREIASIYYNRLMDYRTAALEFEKLVHEFPEREEAIGFRYRVAQSYFLVNDFDQARAEARMLLKKRPTGRFAAEVRLLVANSYYLQNRLEEAVAAHKQLLDTDTDVPIRARSQFELGMCYQDLGEKNKAESSFLAAIKDHPRPDLVQMQLKELQKLIGQDSKKSKPLPFATATPTATPATAQPAPKTTQSPQKSPDEKTVSGQVDSKSAQ